MAAAAALALRLALFAPAAGDPARLMIDSDSREYLTLGRNLANGRGFSQMDGPPFAPDVRRTPVYPATIAPLFAAGFTPATAAALANIAAATMTIVVVVLLAARLMGDGAALPAGVFLALDLTSAAYSTQVLTEPLFTLLVCLAVLAAIDRMFGDRMAVCVAGVITGIAALCRPIGVFFAGALVPAWFLRAPRLSRHAVVLALAAAIVSAAPAALWTVRNKRVAGVSTFTSQAATNAYFHRAAYVVAEIEHRPVEIVRDEWERELERDSRRWSEADRIRWMNEHGSSVVLRHPVVYLAVLAKGVFRMAAPDSEVLRPLLGLETTSATWRAIWAAAWLQLIVVYSLSARGTWRAVRQSRVAAFVVLAFIGYFLVLAGPEMYARFRVPMMPAICMLAARGAVRRA
jgi:4-amino-4-deoxy-L-arabinose transferase-like glycosyltransferase